MPPKVRITKDDIIKASIEIVRREGEEALNARSIAASIGSSTQPIFSNFANMTELRAAVIDAAEALYLGYIESETASGRYPPYKSSGMAYIRFAKEEKELFKLLYMRDRTVDDIPINTKLSDDMSEVVKGNTGLDTDSAKLFHLEMWIYVHGIASMVATGYLELEEELVSRILTDAYQGLIKRFERE